MENSLKCYHRFDYHDHDVDYCNHNDYTEHHDHNNDCNDHDIEYSNDYNDDILNIMKLPQS